jgi:hypothetical protein
VLDDDRVASKRQVRAVLFARADRNDESRILSENCLDLHWNEVFDSARGVRANRNYGSVRRGQARVFAGQLRRER